MRIEGISGISAGQVQKLGNKRTSFEEVLREEAEKLKFSAHAVERIKERRIEMDEDRMRRLMGAVKEARERGARETVVIIDGIALVVSVENRTVITAVEPRKEGRNVFTQIDSVVLA